MTISFEATRLERFWCRKVVDRAEVEGLLNGRSRFEVEMDLIATHVNGCPMDFYRMMTGDLPGFAHDIHGIAHHLDRSTGKLMDCFVPRFARAEG